MDATWFIKLFGQSRSITSRRLQITLRLKGDVEGIPRPGFCVQMVVVWQPTRFGVASGSSCLGYRRRLPRMDCRVDTMRNLRRAIKVARTGTGEVARAIESCSFKLSERGFTMLIVTCRRSGKWKKAMEIFDTMNGDVVASSGVKPNFYTFSSLISVCCNGGACSKALQVFKSMKQAALEAPELAPDAEVYSTLIRGLSRGSWFVDAVQVFYESKALGLLLDNHGLVATIEALVDVCMLDDGVDAVDSLHGRGQLLPNKMYIQFLKSCADEGRVDVCVDMFIMMQMAGVEALPGACHQVMRAAANAGNCYMCVKLMQELDELNIDVSQETYECYNRAMERLEQKPELQWRSNCLSNVSCHNGR